MGAFRRAPLHIEFGPDDADGTLEGFEARMRRPTVAMARRAAKLQALIGNRPDGDEPGDEELDEMIGMLSRHLISWNWADPASETDEIAPTTPEGLESLDLDVLMLLTDKWMGDAAPDPELGKGSATGAHFQVELPTTVPSLENLASLSRPNSI